MQLMVNGYNVNMYVLWVLGRFSFSQWVFVVLGHIPLCGGSFKKKMGVSQWSSFSC